MRGSVREVREVRDPGLPLRAGSLCESSKGLGNGGDTTKIRNTDFTDFADRSRNRARPTRGGELAEALEAPLVCAKPSSPAEVGPRGWSGACWGYAGLLEGCGHQRHVARAAGTGAISVVSGRFSMGSAAPAATTR